MSALSNIFKQKSVVVHNITIFDRPLLRRTSMHNQTTQSPIDFSLRVSKLLCTEDVNAPVWGWAGVAPAAAGSTGSAGSAPPQTAWSAAQEHQRPLYPERNMQGITHAEPKDKLLACGFLRLKWDWTFESRFISTFANKRKPEVKSSCTS